MNSYVVIEVLGTTEDDRIASCRVRGVFEDEEKAREVRSVCRSSKVIIVPNISMKDIPSIIVSDWQN